MTDAEAAVRELEAAYDRAWIAGDLDALISCLSEDAVVVTPRDDVASGRDGVRQLFATLLNGPARASKHTSRIVRVSFITDDVAIVDGEAFIDGVDAEEFGAPTITHRFTDVLRKNNGDWAVVHIRAYAMATSTRNAV